MGRIFTAIVDFFNYQPGVYSHRNRTIEIIALEKNIDIESIKHDTLKILDNEGSVEAISKLRRRFHVTLNAAWRFVEKLEKDRVNGAN